MNAEADRRAAAPQPPPDPRQTAAAPGRDSIEAHESAAVASQRLSGPTSGIARHAAASGSHDAYLAVVALMAVPFFLAFFINDKKAATLLRQRMQQPQIEPV